MPTVTIQEAEANLSELIDKACAGEEIVMTQDSRPVARLVGLKAEKPKEPRQFGLLKGKLHVGPEFFEPLPDDELEAWCQ